MCRSIIEGGRRCPCSTDNTRRNERDRARYAAHKAAGATRAPKTNPPSHPIPAPPPTPLATQVADARSALDSIYARDNTHTLAGTETAIGAIGAQVSDRANEIAGTDPDTIYQDWKQRHDDALAARDAAFANANATAKHRNTMQDTHGLDSPEYAAAATAAQQADAAQRDAYLAWNTLTDGYDPETTTQLLTLSDGYRQALAEIRPMGGSITTLGTSNSRATKVLNEAADYYPTEWVDASNTAGNLRAKSTSGRAHYGALVAQKKRTKIAANHGHYGTEPPTVDAGSHLMWEHEEGPDHLGNSTWRAYYVSVRRHPNWGYGESMTGTPPRGWTQRAETFTDGTEITVWIKPRTRLKADSYTSELTIDKSTYQQTVTTPGLSTATHEFAHRSEHMRPALGGLQEAFLKRRTSNPDGSRHELERYHGSTREKVRPDDFANQYIGKVYTGSRDTMVSTGEHSPAHREVLSCGMESLFTGSNGGLVGVGRYKADPDMRNFILGTLATA